LGSGTVIVIQVSSEVRLGEMVADIFSGFKTLEQSSSRQPETKVPART